MGKFCGVVVEGSSGRVAYGNHFAWWELGKMRGFGAVVVVCGKKRVPRGISLVGNGAFEMFVRQFFVPLGCNVFFVFFDFWDSFSFFSIDACGDPVVVSRVDFRGC